ncbi:UreD urease accessory protein-domain-containing protein [Pelagophyceae sp. CCMP2097]|nr:UreD urease accessory protein-domain-containing protein [Pelagophyceae sp. CCMP2097]
MPRAEVVAAWVDGRTQLSRVVHASPLRIQTVPSACSKRAGAAHICIANLGGGFVTGDHVAVEVDVRAGATLHVGTQASAKVYKGTAGQRISANVGAGALLVYAPDATVPFALSSFDAETAYALDAQASLVCVEWVQGGRTLNGERWAFDKYQARTTWTANGKLLAKDAVLLDARSRKHFDLGNARYDHAVTVGVFGARGSAVAERFDRVARLLAQRRGARTAPAPAPAGDAAPAGELGDAFLATLRGGVVLGCSRDGSEVLFTARLVATFSDDVYRILHACLAPLRSDLGFEPYDDRIHATTSLAKARQPEFDEPFSTPESAAPSTATFDAASFGLMLQLSDSGLPTGGFVDSSGLESAAQLGLVRPHDTVALSQFVSAVAASHLQLQAPFAEAAHDAFDKPDASSDLALLDGELESLLQTLQQARLASKRRAKAICRVAEELLSAAGQGARPPRIDHGVVAFGALAARLGCVLPLPRAAMRHVLYFTVVRDAFSAAVRLNLVGPLRAVGLQAALLRGGAPQVAGGGATVPDAASNSPLLDAAHAVHAILDMRLFQS